MASSYTGLGTELMTTGENAGTWGSTTNTNLQIIEQISGGYTEQDIAGSADTTTLSVSDGSTGAVLSHRIIKFTGTITGNQIVTIPLDVQQMYILVNGTSGAYTVQFKYASGSGSSVTFAATDKGTKVVYATADHATNPNLVDSGISSTGAHDLDGNEFIIDADGDTSLTADTDDQIDIRLAGADDFTFTANAFNVLTGSNATFADSANAKFGTGNDMLLYHDGSNSYITNAVGALKIATETSGIAVTIGHTTSETTIADNLTVTGTLTGTLATAAQGSVTSLGTLTTLTVDNIIVNGTTIGHTSDTDLLTLTSGVATVAGELDATTLDISGNADIDGTTNLDAVDIDGAVQLDATFTVGVDDTGHDVKFFGATSGAYMLWDESTDDLVLAGAAKLYLYDAGGGEYISSSGSALTIASGGTAWELPAADGSNGQLLKTDGSGNLDWTTVVGTITALNNATANELVTVGSTTTELDAEANLTFDGTDVLVGGAGKLQLRDTALFINSSTDGQLDIDADTEVEITTTTVDLNGALDVSGNSQFSGTITVGVDDTGKDVKLFGATSGSFLLWDESADALLLTDSTPIQIGDAQDLTLYHDGTNSYITNAVGALKIATETSGIAVTIGHSTSEVTIADNLTVTGTLTLGSNAELTEAELEMLDGITAGTVAASKAVVVDSNKDAASFRNVTLTGELDAATLDISGNADIDGTTNLDAVDIDGAVQLDATLTIGANDQGYDVILYGDTASANVTWDTSADDLIFNGAARIVVPDGQLVLGSTAVSSTAAELNLLDNVSGLVQADLTKLAAVDSTAAELNIVDGGTSATSTTVADADRVVLNDNGTMVQVAMTDIKTYIGGGTSWQAVKTGDYTASAGQGVFVNTTSAAITITLPAGTIGDEVSIIDYAGTADSNNITVAANGSEKIHASTDDLTVATERAAFTLVFTDSTQGWLLKDK